jgi:hypothetical protein
MTDKQAIKDTLLAQAREALAATEAHVADERATTIEDEAGVTGVDDVSQSDEAGDLHGLFVGTADQQREVIATIEALDVGPAETVRPGAVVEYGGDRFLVGVVAAAFEVDGVSYEGISADSPVAQAIEGKRAGDTFEVNGTSHTLDRVV